MGSDARPLAPGPDGEPGPESVAPGHVEGTRLYGELGLALAEFHARAVALAKSHLARLDLAASATRIANVLDRAALADLYLATACEAQCTGSWDVLHARFATRLEGYAVRRGLSSGEAEAVVQDLFGDLASPPPGNRARTVLGTYDGTGSLFGWLSVVLTRRIAGQARKRRPQSLDAQDAAVGEAARPASADAQSVPPPASLVSSEDSKRLTAAFTGAWERLKPQERLALVLKHRDGTSQRDVATFLGVGEARVSRIVSAAVETLASAMRRALGDDRGVERGAATWDALALAVGRHLATCGSRSIPPRDTPARPGGGSPPAGPREDS